MNNCCNYKQLKIKLITTNLIIHYIPIMLNFLKKLTGTAEDSQLNLQYEQYSQEQKNFLSYFYNAYTTTDDKSKLLESYKSSGFTIEACHVYAIPKNEVNKNVPEALAVFAFFLQHTDDEKNNDGAKIIDYLWDKLFNKDYKKAILQEGGQALTTNFLNSIRPRLFNLGVDCDLFASNSSTIDFFTTKILNPSAFSNLSEINEKYAYWSKEVLKSAKIISKPEILKMLSTNYRMIHDISLSLMSHYEKQITDGQLNKVFTKNEPANNEAEASLNTLEDMKSHISKLEKHSPLLAKAHTDNLNLINTILNSEQTIEEKFWVNKLLTTHYPELLDSYYKASIKDKEKAQALLMDSLIEIEKKLNIILESNSDDQIKNLKIKNKFLKL